ncbi:C-X-C chemokine receptor type 3-2-like [Spea bombifrons]|uniref:C-X-C chemokine receptor type 3-2-like n=1 Tax=Spea bombifrons TaxID=233779 RepID=UPI00234910B3|nr:C-X-C chemokine receptor type 3-2-like [Spea bombifrons]
MASGDSSYSYYDYDYKESFTDKPLIPPCFMDSTAQVNQNVISVVFLLVFALDIMGNGLVIYVLSRKGSSWHISDHYLFQLAVSDLLLGLTLPFWITQFLHGWVFGLVPCKLLGALFTINMYSSIFFLVCISLNRYLSVVLAVELHGKQRPIHTFIICALVWSTACMLSWQELYFRDVRYMGHVENAVCYYNFVPQQADTWRITLRLINLSLGFMVPLGLMTFFYSRIFCTLRQSRSNRSRRPQVVIVGLLLVFVLCWMPYNLLLFIDSLQRLGFIERSCQLEKMLDTAVTVTETMGLAHVCLNPFVYAFVGINFRKEIYKLFKRRSDPARRMSVLSSRDGTVETEHNPSSSKIL